MNPTLTRALLVSVAIGILGPASAQEITEVNAIMPKQRSANYFPLIVGEALGYFEEEGVSVNLLPSTTPIPFVNFLRNGSADIAMLDPAEVLQARSAGADVKVVYEVMQRAPDGIAISGESTLTDVAELEGQTVGLVTDRDMTTLRIALDARGLTENDVTSVVVGEAGPTLAAAFRDQSVAAIAGSGPDWLAIQANGIPIKLITPTEVSDKPGNTFVVSGEIDDEKRAALQGYLRAWSKAMYVAEVDPSVVAAIARTAVPEEWEDPSFGQQYLDNAIRLNVSVTEQLGDLQTDIWQRVQPSMQKFGVISAEVPVEDFLDASMIQIANEWDRAEVEAEVAAWKQANGQ